MRRVQGYNLDTFTDTDRWNLSRLIVGSEGTLGVVLQAKLNLEHLEMLHQVCGGIPFVLHGGSGVKRDFLLAAIKKGIDKVNVGTEIRQAYETVLRDSGDLAAAQDALQSGTVALPDGMTAEQAVRNVTTSYAITYLFGLIGLIVIIRTLPRLLGIDLPAEAEKIGGGEVRTDPSERISLRAYRMERDELVGLPYREILERLPPGAAVVKLRREGAFLEVSDATTFQRGDEIALVGTLGRFLEAPRLVGTEITDPDLLDMETESVQIVVTRRDAVGTVLGELGITENYGCFLTEAARVQVDDDANRSAS